MFIAMNRFKIEPGYEQDFVDVWKGRDSYLHTVPGFKEFHLLQGPSNNDFTVFSLPTPHGSHATISKHGQNPKHSGKHMQVLEAEKISTWARHNSNALRLFYRDMLIKGARLSCPRYVG